MMLGRIWKIVQFLSIHQNPFRTSCWNVCQDIIKDEMAQARYIAIMSDECTDVSNQSQLVIVFRMNGSGDFSSQMSRTWKVF